jgi:DNA-binding MarR family transcriptional regulator
MDAIRIMEKQSGFMRLLVYLYDNGEKTVTEILKDTEIPVHQLYSSIEKAKELGLASSSIDNSKYPARNLIYLTDKGEAVAMKIKEIIMLMNK